MNLTARDRHLLRLCAASFVAGRDIVKAYEAETGKRLSYGTLYVRMGRLHANGFVDRKDSRDADGVVRSFKATAAGLEKG